MGVETKMSRFRFTATIFLAAASGVLTAQERTIGLFAHDEGRASAGYTLMAPKHYTRTYLLDNYGRVVKTWDSKYEPGQSAHPRVPALPTIQM